MAEGNPATMMTVVSARVGGAAESMIVEQRPVPRPAPDQVLIRVAAAGINRGDLLQRARTYPAPAGTAFDVLGLEVSGTIAAVGAGVTQFAPGDRVCALMKDGGYAQYALADESLVLRVPRGVDLVDAAALPETYFTVWANVFDRGGLMPGQRFLVHGGSSGIGVTAIQLAAYFGAEVFATAGSAEKCAACQALGARHAINYRDTDFVRAVRDMTAGAGVDLILDMVAGSYLRRNLEALAIEGTVIMIGLLEGVETDFNIVPLLTRRLTITGSTLWARSPAQKAAIREALEQKVWPLFEAGAVRPVVDQVLPLDQAAAAHRLMDQNRHIGKILLRP